MFGGIKVGTLAGIPFFVNPSWFLVFGFVVFSLATSQLPLWVPNLSSWVYWPLAAFVALLFFGSLVAHELGHSIASQHYGIPVRAITLHLFGGVAQLGREVSRAREEFWIAVAGPAVSVVLSALFWGGYELLAGPLPIVAGALRMVALLNIGVVLFNLVPGFPLDGGRVLRALVWGITGNYRKSTWVAATAGRLVGLVLIFLGIYLAITQNDLGSLWLALVGWFLVSLARQSYQQAVVLDTLRKTPVSAAQVRLITVPGRLTIDELFAGYISTTGRRFYLLEDEDQPAGVVDAYELTRLPRHLWPVTPILSVMTPITGIPQVSLSASAMSALDTLEEARSPLLRTVEDGRTIGIVSRNDLVQLMRRPQPSRA